MKTLSSSPGDYLRKCPGLHFSDDYTCLTRYAPFIGMARKLMIFAASSELLIFSVKLTFIQIKPYSKLEWDFEIIKPSML